MLRRQDAERQPWLSVWEDVSSFSKSRSEIKSMVLSIESSDKPSGFKIVLRNESFPLDIVDPLVKNRGGALLRPYNKCYAFSS